MGLSAQFVTLLALPAQLIATTVSLAPMVTSSAAPLAFLAVQRDTIWTPTMPAANVGSAA